MRGKFTGLLAVVTMLMPWAPAIANVGAEPMTGQIDGIAQVSLVPALSLTARPRHVFCGDGVPCPEPTQKTINLRPVQIAQSRAAPAPQPKVVATPPAEPATPPRAQVHFEFGRHALTAEARGRLANFLEQAEPLGGDIHITVDGYTDAVGGKPINDRLARKRAETVKQHLISAGFPAARVRVGKTIGKCCFVAPNDTEAGRAANRRAEVVSLSVTTEKELFQ